MKFYLSSFKLGNKPEELKRLISVNNQFGYIPNACDYTNVDTNKRNEVNRCDITDLTQLGLQVEILDLKNYFSKNDKLREKLKQLGGIFIRGGNTFILRQAMRISGFDIIFRELLERDDFVYSGYSAGICILSKDLKILTMIDDPTDKPYKEYHETIWEGLGFLDYIILPHYKSDHTESAAVNHAVEYCEKNNISYKTLRDGEVIIIE